MVKKSSVKITLWLSSLYFLEIIFSHFQFHRIKAVIYATLANNNVNPNYMSSFPLEQTPSWIYGCKSTN